MARWQGFYDELAERRYPALLAYAMAFAGQRATAEDLVQEAMVRTFSSPRRLSSAQHAEHYVRRAIASVFVDDKRREQLFRRSAASRTCRREPRSRFSSTRGQGMHAAAALCTSPKARSPRWWWAHKVRVVGSPLRAQSPWRPGALASSVVSIDRAKGYPDVSLKLDGMAECPAPTEGPWTVREIDPSSTALALVIQGDLRIDWDDGTTTTALSVALNGRTEVDCRRLGGAPSLRVCRFSHKRAAARDGANRRV